MIAKGHDFKRVSLVVVLNADAQLMSPDVRAEERLYATLMQVAGRAGRAERAGRVMIQTRYPNHPVYADMKTQTMSSLPNASCRSVKMLFLLRFVVRLF